MRRIAALTTALIVALPSLALAFPFGGMINQIIFCYNDAIYTNVGPPRGGPFIWTPSTRTYRFGPPLHTGQWLLGLAAPPYYCIVSKQPIIVWSGILMTMEGSSGTAAPAYQAGGGANGLGGISGLNGGGFGSGVGGTGTGGAGSGAGTGAGVSHVMISEIYPRPDPSHGGDAAHGWIELYNPTTATTTLSHWVVKTAGTTLTLQNGTQIGPRAFLVVTGANDMSSLWTLPQGAAVSTFPGGFSDAFAVTGDHVLLDTDTGSNVDSVSWGNDTSAFSPSAPTPATGHALIRSSLARDLNVAGDWVDTSAPTPGR